MSFSIDIRPAESDPILIFAQFELEKYLRLLADNLPEPENSATVLDANYILQEEPSDLKGKIKTEIKAYSKSKQPDAYGIIAQNNRIFFFGKSSRAVLFAVYDFLQLTGIRWFFPGKKHQVIPKKLDGLAYNVKKVEIPAFPERGVVVAGKLSNCRAWIDYAAKHRLNVVGLRTFTYYYKLLPDAQIRGMELHVQKRGLGTNLCGCDKTGFDDSEKKLGEFLQELPVSVDRVYCWHSDRYVFRCRCEADAKLHVSDMLLRRLNLLVNHPKVSRSKKMAFFANSGTWAVPRVVRPHPRIFVEMAPSHRCLSHGIADPFCQQNQKFVKPEIEDHLKRFGTDSAVMVDYWLDASLQWRLGYFRWFGAAPSSLERLPHIPRIMKKDLEYYHQLGIRTILAFAIGINDEYLTKFTSPLINFYPKLVWNPTLSVQSLLEDFCLDYYGSSKYRMFFDENELIDPQDMSKPQFSGFIQLAIQRIDILSKYLKTKISVKIKNRVKRLIKEQELKASWKHLYFLAKIRSYWEQFCFQHKRIRS